MSHTMNISVEFHDRALLIDTLERMGIPTYEGSVTYYDRTTKTGLCFRLPGWQYPCVLSDKGELSMDNFEGHWGDDCELGNVKAHYGLSKARREALIKGYDCIESENEQELTLTIEI